MQATIMTDPGTADRTYIGPMTPELVEQILDKVSCQAPARMRFCVQAGCAMHQVCAFCTVHRLYCECLRITQSGVHCLAGEARSHLANNGWPDRSQSCQGSCRGELHWMLPTHKSYVELRIKSYLDQVNFGAPF